MIRALRLPYSFVFRETRKSGAQSLKGRKDDGDFVSFARRIPSLCEKKVVCVRVNGRSMNGKISRAAVVSARHGNPIPINRIRYPPFRIQTRDTYVSVYERDRCIGVVEIKDDTLMSHSNSA